MPAYRSFIPGARYNLRKMINYNGNGANKIECNCFKESYKQLTSSENDPNSISNTLRISNLIQMNIGGRVRFGNSYLNEDYQPLTDSLGSVEGQPGGSYRPLRNKF